MQYTAIIKQVDDWWIGWIEELTGVHCQEKSHPDLIASLKVTLREAIDLNKLEAIESAGKNYIEEIIAV
jgi:hypothetical protein